MSWNIDTKQNTNTTRVPFLSFKQGKYQVRFIGAPVQAARFQNGKQVVNVRADSILPQSLRDAGFEKKDCWYSFVIDRADGMLKIVCVGTQIAGHMSELNSNEDYGNCASYDVIVTVNPGDPSKYYTVMPKLPKPMSSLDHVLVAEADADLLKKFANPDDTFIAQKLAQLGLGTVAATVN